MIFLYDLPATATMATKINNWIDLRKMRHGVSNMLIMGKRAFPDHISTSNQFEAQVVLIRKK